jgi:hypothetical protein
MSMPALSTYDDLVNTTLSYLARDDDGAEIPVATFIELSEKEFNRRLRTHYQETSSTFSTVANQSQYSIPADCLNIREITVTGTNATKPLLYVSPNSIDDYYHCSDGVGYPHVYTIEGQNLRIGPSPNSGDYTIVIKYYQKISALDADNINWLFINFPDLYLYSALCEAMIFLGEDTASERLQFFEARKNEIYQEITSAEMEFKTTSGPAPAWRPASIRRRSR